MNKQSKVLLAAAFAVLSGASVFAAGDALKGWMKAGSDARSYEASVDKGKARGEHNSVRYRSLENVKEDGFGTMMQIIQSDEYKGKRVRLSAYIKAEKVSGWAGLWMRIDGREVSEPLAYDNMGDRAIKGTGDWKKCEVVLDVPEDGSTAIAFGFMLSGNGTIWVSEMVLAEVDKSVPVTRPATNSYPLYPVNMDFRH